MADEIQLPSRSENKRKYVDQSAYIEDPPVPAVARRATGFSSSLQPAYDAAEAPPSSYNADPSVPPIARRATGFSSSLQPAYDAAEAPPSSYNADPSVPPIVRRATGFSPSLQPSYDAAEAPPSSYKAESAVPPAARRATGFSPSLQPSYDAAEAPPSSYNAVAPPMDGFQLAKQRAQEIAARLLNNAEAKRPRLEDNEEAEDPYQRGFDSSTTVDHSYAHHSQFQQKAFHAQTYETTSKMIQIPKSRVGAVIGRGGETIKFLQLQSGAKIQVTRYEEADPYSQTRTVELSGTTEQVDKAEQLVNDVLQEAEVGSSGQKFGGSEQFMMKVPNSKVGLVIGKGGESIKGMQARTGARIQVIPVHPPPGDYSTERTVQIDGTQEQIESAKELISELISENRVRNPSSGGGYHHSHQAPTNWGGPRGPPPIQPSAYGYAPPGVYAAYPPPPPPLSAASGYNGYWDQQQPPPSGAAVYPGYSQDGGGDSYGYGMPPPGYYFGGYDTAPASHEDGGEADDTQS